MRKIVSFVSDNFLIINIAVVVAGVILFVLHINPLSFLILASVYTLTFLIAKEDFNAKKFRWMFIMARIVIILLTLALLLSSVYLLGSFAGEVPMQLYWMVVAGGGIAMTALLFAGNRQKEEQMENISLGRFIKDTKEETEQAIKLCKNKETGEDIYISYLDRFLHMLIIGPTGCGKTSQVLIPMIQQDIQNQNCGVTVLEPKGDLAEKVYAMCRYYGRPCLYFNPTNPDCPTINPLDGKEEDVIENITTTFNMLNPDSATYFKDMTDNLLRKSLMVLKRLEAYYMDKKTGISERPATLIELSSLIHNTANKGAKMVKEFQKMKCSPLEKKQNDDTAAWFLDEYFIERSKVYENTSGVRAQVAKLTSNKYLRRVLNPENGKSDINIDQILENGGVLAISTAQGQLRQLGSYLGYFIILSYQASVFKRPGTEWTRKPHYLYIDEFQTYSNPGFSDMLTQGRSYRVASHLATQARAQMAMGSGREGQRFVELVSANARNVVLFPGISPSDAEYYSKEFGEKAVIQIQKGITKQQFNPLYGFRAMNYPTESVRESEQDKAIYSLKDLVYKEFGEITYKIIKNSSVQFAANGIVTWIDKDLNQKLDQMVLEYQEEERVKQQILDEKEEHWADEENQREGKNEQEQSNVF